MAEKVRAKVTDTKQAIYKTYREHIEELNARHAGSLDAAKVVEEKAKVQTLQRVEQVANLDVPTTIAQLQTTINQTLTGILSTLGEKRTALATVEEAIRIKEAELKDLYGIEKEAGSLAALIESHKKMELELDTDLDTRRSELEEELQDARKSYEAQRKQWEEEIKAYKAADLTQRRRELEEYTYKFNRDKQIALDALNDEISKKNLVINQREDAVAQREQNMNILEERVKTLEAKIITEVEAAVAATEKRAKASAEMTARFAEMKHQGEIEKLTSQVESTNTRCSDLIAQNTKLQEALEKASEKIQTIASEALRSGADAKTIAEMRSFESGRSGK